MPAPRIHTEIRSVFWLLVFSGVFPAFLLHSQESSEVSRGIKIGVYATSSQSGGGDDLQELPAVSSSNGILETELYVKYREHKIGSSQARLRSYFNPIVPVNGPCGPTWRIQPNDTLVVTVHNELPPNPSPVTDGNPVPNHPNTTNLHAHGFHVSPYEDDIFRRIQPSFSSRYIYRLRDHMPGTFWYHPHAHGSTGIQVASGMSGVIIVEGDFDHIEEISNAREQVLLFNQIVFAPGSPGVLPDFETLFNITSPPEGTTINGQVKPIIHICPGEVQRWRIVNSGFKEALAFTVDEHAFHQIAVDGIPFQEIRLTDTIAMAPGNRTDFLIKASEIPGDYLLRPITYDPTLEYNLEGEVPELVRSELENDGDYLAVLRVRGESMQMKLPKSISGAPSLRIISKMDVSNSDSPRKVHFTMGFDPDAPNNAPPYWRLKFGVGGRRFSGIRIDHTLELGKSEEWHITAQSSQPHPFHIHINPFLVYEIGGHRLSTPMWKDTVMAPPGPDGVRFYSRYDNFVGDFVLHCHILTHEDAGMMQRVRVQ